MYILPSEQQIEFHIHMKRRLKIQIDMFESLGF
jgi:hypothetical protein